MICLLCAEKQVTCNLIQCDGGLMVNKLEKKKKKVCQVNEVTQKGSRTQPKDIPERLSIIVNCKMRRM